MITGITAITASLAAVIAPEFFGSGSLFAEPSEPFADALNDLEKRSGGRLGVALLDTGSGRRVEHRGGERFAMCSTFKLLASTFVLARVDRGEERLTRRMTFTKEEIQPHSPLTEPHVGGEGMTMEELCFAAMTQSDNTAANMLLESFGGPAGLTGYLRTIGDEVTRLDRTEITLNTAIPGDPRDTTTPAAMLGDLRRILLGDVLKPGSRAKLVEWMVANLTGDARVRAGLPKTWKVGDKTGSGDYGTTNVVGAIWPPARKPVLFAVYLTETKLGDDARNAIHAEVGRMIAREFGGR